MKDKKHKGGEPKHRPVDPPAVDRVAERSVQEKAVKKAFKELITVNENVIFLQNFAGFKITKLREFYNNCLELYPTDPEAAERALVGIAENIFQNLFYVTRLSIFTTHGAGDKARLGEMLKNAEDYLVLKQQNIEVLKNKVLEALLAAGVTSTSEAIPLTGATVEPGENYREKMAKLKPGTMFKLAEHCSAGLLEALDVTNSQGDFSVVARDEANRTIKIKDLTRASNPRPEDRENSCYLNVSLDFFRNPEDYVIFSTKDLITRGEYALELGTTVTVEISDGKNSTEQIVAEIRAGGEGEIIVDAADKQVWCDTPEEANQVLGEIIEALEIKAQQRREYEESARAQGKKNDGAEPEPDND